MCSSLSWLLLMTFCRSLGCNLLTASKILGILFGCCSLALIYKITKLFTTRFPWVIVPALLTSLSLPFLMWNQMGLETALYTLVFLCLILICLDKDLFFYWPLIAVVLVVTRPEGFFLLLGLLPAFWFHKDQKKQILLSIFLFGIVCLTLGTVRFFYFHDFLPSAFYIKIYKGKYLAGITYVHLFFKDYYLYYFCIPLVWIIWRKWNWQENRFIVFGFMIIYLLWIILGGGEPKVYYRQIVPLIPVLYVYIITGLEHTCGNFTLKKQLILGIGITTFSVTSLLFSSNYWLQQPIANPVAKNINTFFNNPYGYLTLFLKRIQNPSAFHQFGYSKKQQYLLGEFIKRNYLSGTTLLYDQMGETPYTAGIDYYFIDSWGLTDKKIGRYYFLERSKGSPLLELYDTLSLYLIKRFFPQTEYLRSRKDALDYIFMRDPDVILIKASLIYFKQCIPHWLIKMKTFKANYNLHYYISDTLVYEKKGLIKNSLSIPDGLSIVFAKDVRKQGKNKRPSAF